jgi:hypothetical protein
LNKVQSLFVAVGVALLALALLRPPQRINLRALHLPPGTRQFYWIYPDGQGLPMETDWPRLAGTMAVITLVTAGAVLAFRPRREAST